MTVHLCPKRPVLAEMLLSVLAWKHTAPSQLQVASAQVLLLFFLIRCAMIASGALEEAHASCIYGYASPLLSTTRGSDAPGTSQGALVTLFTSVIVLSSLAALGEAARVWQFRMLIPYPTKLLAFAACVVQLSSAPLFMFVLTLREPPPIYGAYATTLLIVPRALRAIANFTESAEPKTITAWVRVCSYASLCCCLAITALLDASISSTATGDSAMLNDGVCGESLPLLPIQVTVACESMWYAALACETSLYLAVEGDSALARSRGGALELLNVTDRNNAPEGGIHVLTDVS